MLAIDGEDFDAVFAGFGHDDFAGHDEDFLGGDGDVFAGADRGEGGLEPGGANDGDEDDVGGGEGGEFDEAFVAAADFGAGTELFFEGGGFFDALDADGCGFVFARLLDEEFGVVAGGEAD
jgi:hypothetical protein